VEEKGGRGSGKGADKGKGIRGWWRGGHTTTKTIPMALSTQYKQLS